jgi:hypothetical protein
VRLLDRVGGRQVIVLAGVDDDAAPGDDAARDVLIDERPAHVDVAKEDPVHRVVEQHVEPFDRAHPGDLGHAEPRRVVGLVDVAPIFVARLVDGAPDERKFSCVAKVPPNPLVVGPWGTKSSSACAVAR